MYFGQSVVALRENLGVPDFAEPSVRFVAWCLTYPRYRHILEQDRKKCKQNRLRETEGILSQVKARSKSSDLTYQA